MYSRIRTHYLNRTPTTFLLFRTNSPTFYASDNNRLFSTKAAMASQQHSGTENFPDMANKPGENFEVRQTSSDDDYTPDPSKSIPLPPNRQALVDDILALYGCEPTIERVKRYTPDCVYDDQFVYANDRYKMAGQWFALPKLFKASKNERYQIVKNDRDLIQFKNEQVGNPLLSHSKHSC